MKMKNSPGPKNCIETVLYMVVGTHNSFQACNYIFLQSRNNPN